MASPSYNYSSTLDVDVCAVVDDVHAGVDDLHVLVVGGVDCRDVFGVYYGVGVVITDHCVYYCHGFYYNLGFLLSPLVFVLLLVLS